MIVTRRRLWLAEDCVCCIITEILRFDLAWTDKNETNPMMAIVHVDYAHHLSVSIWDAEASTDFGVEESEELSCIYKKSELALIRHNSSATTKYLHKSKRSLRVCAKPLQCFLPLERRRYCQSLPQIQSILRSTKTISRDLRPVDCIFHINSVIIL